MSVHTDEEKKKPRLSHSIAMRTIGVIAISCILLGALATVIGLTFYNRVLSNEYVRRAYDIARHASRSVQHAPVDVEGYSKEIMRVYRSLSEDQRNQIDRPPYEQYFAFVDKSEDSIYKYLASLLGDFITEEDVSDVYLAMYDEKTGALVYLVDPESEYQFMPGEWEAVSKTELDTFLKWDGTDMLFDISDTYRYGWMCTAGYPIRDKSGEVYAFVLSDIRSNTIRINMFAYTLQIAIAIVLATVLIVFLLSRFMSDTLVKPIHEIERAAELYVKDKKAGLTTTRRFKKLNIHSSNELENLSLTMAKMEESLSEHEEYMTKINAQKQRIEAELDMAARIQASMLPSTFPAFPERNEFDIYAIMHPTWDVGGDFYDFFLIDDDHLCLVMADVSGKGIPAALFMMIAKVIAQSCAMLGKSASEILDKTNEALCSNNKTEMFVTMWLGIVELSTGKLTASNAGHEFPAILKNGKKFELLKDKHSLFIGGMPDTKYTEYTVQLEPGDKLFQYTDGVTEATNSKLELFGTDRMVKALNIDPTQSPECIINTVKDAVDKFVGKAEQFDDITMLCFEYKGK